MRNTHQEIFEHIRANGGATVQLYFGQDHLMDSRDGDVYLVGGARGVESRMESVHTFSVASVTYWLECIKAKYAETGGMDYYSAAGFWVHDGLVHIDLVDAYMGREYALQLAAERGELAIYSLATGDVITVPASVEVEQEA